MTQRVNLSDSRWLELNLTFDGLGLNSQVVYSDPALASDTCEQETEDFAVAPAPIFNNPIDPSDRKAGPLRTSMSERWLRGLISASPVPAIAWALLLAITLGSGGYAGYRYMHPGWRDVLARAQDVAVVPSPTEALHQTIRIEEASGPEIGVVLGSVDVWRRSDRTVVRRLYNTQQTLLVTSIDSGNGMVVDRFESNASIGKRDHELTESGVWRSDLAAKSIDTGEGTTADAIRRFGGFEVTQSEDGQRGILSRTLVLDANYQVQAERVRFNTAEGISEVRLVQTLLRRVPDRDVPAWAFPQSPRPGGTGGQSGSVLQNKRGANPTEDAEGTNLEVSLLFELFKLNADIEQPIEVTPASGGRVRMTGTLNDAQLLAKIRERITGLPDAGRVDFKIQSFAEAASSVHRGTEARQELVGNGSDAPAAGLVRNALVARGLQEAALKDAEQRFAASALSHAQLALQHAYALDRLGGILGRAGAASLDSDSREQWAQMVDRHSAAAKDALQALRLQLDSVSAGTAAIPVVDAIRIGDPAAFVRAASDLRARTQSVNENVVELFAGSAVNVSPAEANAAMNRLRANLPTFEAGQINSFAGRLANRNSPVQSDVGEIQPR